MISHYLVNLYRWPTSCFSDRLFSELCEYCSCKPSLPCKRRPQAIDRTCLAVTNTQPVPMSDLDLSVYTILHGPRLLRIALRKVINTASDSEVLCLATLDRNKSAEKDGTKSCGLGKAFLKLLGLQMNMLDNHSWGRNEHILCKNKAWPSCLQPAVSLTALRVRVLRY